MKRIQTIKITLVLASLLLQNVFPVIVIAAETDSLAKNSGAELLFTESSGGKLFQPAQIVKLPSKTVMTVLTAYSSTPDQTDSDPFIAASGKHVYDGMVAANWLPLGTKIKIPALYGDKVFTVDDRMNPRYGYGRMDIWMDAPIAQVKKFGVKRAPVEIYFVEKSIKVAKIDRI
ncbi:MAG: hypothetical protein WCV83_02395 [Candidatus Magasanikbacteria bacterium]|jgi:hypothetical protein